ncbi:DEAD/DEAH box helicase [Clostridium sp. CTA-19]
MNKIKFEDLNLKPSILEAINDLKFEYPSDIQAKSIPVSLEGFDLIGQAQTGTGKTVAFGAPLLSLMEPSNGNVQAIMLAPTRELAIQVSEELSKLNKYAQYKILPIFGGQSIDKQLKPLKKGVDIVVGTPGRILYHINRKTLKLDHAKFLVLDEADEMLNMGFIEDIELIISNLKKDRQTLLFSATMPKAIKSLAQNYMKSDAKHIAIAKQSLTVSKIKQFYFEVSQKDKLEALCRILDVDAPKSAILFCKTKRGVDELVSALQSKGYIVEGMHGDMKQLQRLNTLKKFKTGNLNYLIATDVAARGIDVEDITHVINYDLPQDTESYVHRIGRTGRANKEGTAYSFASRREMSMIRQIENVTKSKMEKKQLPTLNDIYASKSESILESVKATLEENSYESFIQTSKNLIDEFGAEDVTASLIKILFDKELNYEYTQDTLKCEEPFSRDSNRRDSNRRDFNRDFNKDTARLFLSVGRLDKVSAIDLVKFLDNTAGVKSKELGRIDILDKFTFIDVPNNLVDVILKNSSGQKINNVRKVRIEVSHKRK